jgi:ribosomal protein S7
VLRPPSRAVFEAAFHALVPTVEPEARRVRTASKGPYDCPVHVQSSRFESRARVWQVQSSRVQLSQVESRTGSEVVEVLVLYELRVCLSYASS